MNLHLTDIDPENRSLCAQGLRELADSVELLADLLMDPVGPLMQQPKEAVQVLTLALTARRRADQIDPCSPENNPPVMNAAVRDAEKEVRT